MRATNKSVFTHRIFTHKTLANNKLTCHSFISKIVLLLSSVLMLSACSSLPESLKASGENVFTDYSSWVNSPVAVGSEVRLGGVIANVTNLTNQTRIEVVNLPIGSSGKPDISQEPQGRFVGYVDGFVDPVTYANGRLITVIGVGTPAEQKKVGEYQYTFPVMAVKGAHLWRIEERVIVNEVGSYLSLCNGLYCRQRAPSSREGRVVQQVK
ncbi:Slp family lipoprotein [Vibrio aestuarianus]|uniref:Slp family lipoprotein n=1 Tax=Vibrio aestuarianus TaxID=28171 RepID=UPI001559EAFF|nr:Slp family lipoprotein [Vibrio aestuarianus]NGZ12556.1 Slp family lipoprotein [Vibrio aestuarianus]NKZ48704.1 Slp family lipoprotein [Vibrio aestuarianus]